MSIKFRIVMLGLFCFALAAQEDVYYFPITQKGPGGILVRKPVGPSKIINITKKTQRDIDGPSLKKGQTVGGMISQYQESGILTGAVGEKIFCIDECFYAVHSDTEAQDHGEPVLGTTLLRKEGPNWVPEAKYITTNSKSKPWIIPLRNGNFFALDVYGKKDDQGDKVTSIFQILKKNSKGQLKRASEEDDHLGSLRQNDEILHVLNHSGPIVFTEDYMVVFVYPYGIYWSVSLENGSLKGPDRLYSGITDQVINGTTRIIRPVINVQPDMNGKIIIAARPEQAVLEGGALAKAQEEKLEAMVKSQKDMNPADMKASYKTLVNEVYIQYPFVKWFRLDPRNLSIQSIDPSPSGGKVIINSVEEFRNFFWVMDDKDQVIYLKTSLDEFISGPSPDPKPKSKPRPKGK